MRKYLFNVLLVLLLLGFVSCSKTEIQPPVAEKIKKELINHGITRVDNYFWLNDRENPKVINYLNAENDYLTKMTAHTSELKKTIYDEMVGRISQVDKSVPYKKNGYYYYKRDEAGKEYQIYCRKKENLENKEEILLDGNEMAAGKKYFAIGGLEISENNKLLAFGIDTVSRRNYTLNFQNLETGEVYPEKIQNTTGTAIWANDNKTVFYLQKDSTLRAVKVFKHVLGTETSKDVEIFYEADNTFNLNIIKSKSGKYIFIYSGQTLSTEVMFLDANTPNSKFKVLQPREKNLEYDVEHFGNDFIIRTNLNAVNFKLVSTPVNKTEKTNWKDIISHREDVLLEGFEVFKNHLVINERKDGLLQLRVKTWKGDVDYYLEFGDKAFSAGFSTNPEFDTEILRYSYASLTMPNSIYDFNMLNKEQKLMKQDEVVGGYDKNNYESDRFFITARDGIKVPVSLVYKKGMKKDGKNPLLLYAYGSYGASTDPSFSSARLSLLDRGFIYAIAHIRGGQEMGRKWYEDGKLFKKMNTFADYIDCGKELIAQGYTSKEKLCAQGGSAGGLLMGAVMNLQPDIFKAVIAGVPFVDVVTTMLDDTIPLTTFEYDEWGNPNQADYFKYMLSYSPYDNVKAMNYPATLVTTGLHDSQVQYWEPAKWVAKLREMKTDKNPLLLLTDMAAGHGGASGRFKRFERVALEYAFLIDMVK